MYTPNKIVVAHDYGNRMGRVNDQEINSVEWTTKGMTPEFTRMLYDKAVGRIATLLGFPEGGKDVASLSLLTSYGLGNKRTLDQLIEFTGIDTRGKDVFADRCVELQWVPFEADADPSTISRDVWGQAPEMLLKGGAGIPLVTSGAVELLPESLFTESLADRQRRRATAAESDAAAAISEEAGEPDSAGRPNLRAGKVFEPIVLDLPHKKGGATEELVDAFRHRGKELWWVFQSVDTAVESLMNHIDEEVGMGHGHRVSRRLCAVFVRVRVLGERVFASTVDGHSAAYAV